MKKEEKRIEEKTKICFNCYRDGPATPVRKHHNGLKVHEKTVRIRIKQDLSPDLNQLDYKTNATSV